MITTDTRIFVARVRPSLVFTPNFVVEASREFIATFGYFGHEFRTVSGGYSYLTVRSPEDVQKAIAAFERRHPFIEFVPRRQGSPFKEEDSAMSGLDGIKAQEPTGATTHNWIDAHYAITRAAYVGHGALQVYGLSKLLREKLIPLLTPTCTVPEVDFTYPVMWTENDSEDVLYLGPTGMPPDGTKRYAPRAVREWLGDKQFGWRLFDDGGRQIVWLDDNTAMHFKMAFL